jgi:hypothetical protein
MGSFHQTNIPTGKSNNSEITKPFVHPFSFRSEVEIRMPDATHKENAERFPFQVRFMATIGITSITPATAPNMMPRDTFGSMLVI